MPPLSRQSLRGRMNPAAVRAYDIRGAVGADLDEVDARLLGGAYAGLAQERGLRRIAVGRDGRLSSPALESALVEGLAAGGMHVTRIGLGPTPMTAYAVRALGLDGGITVTASHNPPGENGFKLLLGAERIHGPALRALTERVPATGLGGRVETRPVQAEYVEQLLASAPGVPALSVAWDAGNGAAGAVLDSLLAGLPGRHLRLNTEVDGRFPAHHPDPAVEANMAQLKAAVRANGCDLGIAFDGDGDRIGVVDGEGEMIWADQLLLFLAADLLKDRPGAVVCADVKSSRVFFDGVAALGGRAVMSPSGYVRVRDCMRDSGAALGGELSGHIFYAEGWDGTDDALHAALRLLKALGRSGRSLADFRRSLPPTLFTPEHRLPCPEARKAAVVEEVGTRLAAAGVQVERCDGLRVTTADGWWLLRASGTESKLTCRAESSDAAGLTRLTGQLKRELALSGLTLEA
jgi:phosphomannomutase